MHLTLIFYLFILTVISKVRKYFIAALNFVTHFAKNSLKDFENEYCPIIVAFSKQFL